MLRSSSIPSSGSLKLDFEPRTPASRGDRQLRVRVLKRTRLQVGLDRSIFAVGSLPWAGIDPKPIYLAAFCGRPDQGYGPSVISHGPNRQRPMVVRCNPHAPGSIRGDVELLPELPATEVQVLAQPTGVLGEHPTQRQRLQCRYSAQTTRYPPRQSSGPPTTGDLPHAPGRRMCFRFGHRGAR